MVQRSKNNIPRTFMRPIYFALARGTKAIMYNPFDCSIAPSIGTNGTSLKAKKEVQFAILAFAEGLIELYQNKTNDALLNVSIDRTNGIPS